MFVHYLHIAPFRVLCQDQASLWSIPSRYCHCQLLLSNLQDNNDISSYYLEAHKNTWTKVKKIARNQIERRLFVTVLLNLRTFLPFLSKCNLTPFLPLGRSTVKFIETHSTWELTNYNVWIPGILVPALCYAAWSVQLGI